ncbi:MAG: PASTA domain-containing protein [Clostridia bacterium]|nr:PASTA domain-containing protein [Clostridia bacterium]
MPSIERLCPGCMKDNGGQSVCGVCGYDSTKGNAPDKLPLRFIIRDRYFVGRVIYSDVFMTVYLGFDTIENKSVSIKEYFPKSIAERNPDKTVYVSQQYQFDYNNGLIQFIEVNRKLVGYPLASLLSTYSVFEENSTAYAITESVSAITLKSFLARNGGNLRWEQIRPLFLPLIDTVKSLHDMGIIHGAISPETVLVCRDGKLRLMSTPMGRNAGSASKVFALYDGYSAAEQYADDGQADEYTDVYSICATLFTALIGTVPPSAEERARKDSLTIPSHFADELPRQVLVSMANGMQIKPEDRTPDVETLKNELIYGETKENVRKVQNAAKKKEKNAGSTKAASYEESVESKGSGVKYAAIAAGITAGVFLLLAAILVLTVFKNQVFKKNEDFSNNAAPSIPETASIGDVDSDAVESKLVYKVPDLLGKYYAEIENSKDCEHIKLVIKGKEYSSTYTKGQICAQSIAGGQSAEHDSVVELTISLGPKEFKMPDLSGYTPEQAKIELLKIGILYDNIEIVDEYDSEAKSGIVLRQDPLRDAIINGEVKVRVFVNSYNGETGSTVAGIN